MSLYECGLPGGGDGRRHNLWTRCGCSRFPETSSIPRWNFSKFLKLDGPAGAFIRYHCRNLSTLLWFSRRRVGTLPESNAAIYPTPTAGGLAGVQVVVAPQSGVAWGYEPCGHMAYHISSDAGVLTRIVQSASIHFDCTDATILLFAANRDYIAEYYEFPESLLLRETGALCLAMQLLAEPLDLSFLCTGYARC